MGRGFAFDLPDGRTAYPPGVHRTASKLLDHIAADPGEAITRHATHWDGLRLPAADSLFQMNSEGTAPEWRPI